MIEAKILADSMAPCGKRLTTFECTYPRAIHSEIMTHRALVKSSASSRAIPVAKLIERVKTNPWIPSYIGANQKGMQAGEELNEEKRAQAVLKWLEARDAAVHHAEYLAALGVSKQVVNRLLEPWMFITVIITGTDLNNFFALRRHEAAEPHFHELADKMWEAREASIPDETPRGGWHTPLFGSGRTGFAPGLIESDEAQVLLRAREAFPNDEEAAARFAIVLIVKIAVGRCARVSYLNHHGVRSFEDDIALHDRLRTQNPPHAAPFEHVAMALDKPERHGCLTGWKSYRMTLPNESVPG